MDDSLRRHKGVWLGTIAAAEEVTGIEKTAEEFRAPATKLIAIRDD